MPCIYAHDSFGRRVSEQLPEELQKIIKNHSDEFNAGLQGPDFLFFDRPMFHVRTNRIGYWQHGTSLAPFLNRLIPLIKEEGTDSGMYAYTLGFLCHFILDSECHSFVIPMSNKPGYRHLAIENEFDRHLLRKDGYRPITYPIWKKVQYNKNIISAIYKTYHPFHLSKKDITRSLKGMRFYKWLLTGGRSIKRGSVRLLMLLSFHYADLEGHMMDLHPKKYAKKTNQSLQFIYDNAIPLALELLPDFHLTVTTGKPLHERFNTTFKCNAQASRPDAGKSRQAVPAASI